MCIAVPGRVVEVKDNTAVLDFMGLQKEVSTHLLDEVILGDYLLVHAGCAIQKLDLSEAEEIVRLYEEIGNAFREDWQD